MWQLTQEPASCAGVMSRGPPAGTASRQAVENYHDKICLQKGDKKMDLTNYSELIEKARKQKAKAVLQWCALHVARTPVNLLHRISHTRFSGVKQRLDERLKNVRERLFTLGNNIRNLQSRRTAVEQVEGLLATCVTCKVVFRTKFGGVFSPNDLALLGPDFAGLADQWLCGKCFEGMQARLHRTAWSFANFVGVVRSCSISGFRIVEEMGWVVTDDEYDRSRTHRRYGGGT